MRLIYVSPLHLNDEWQDCPAEQSYQFLATRGPGLNIINVWPSCLYNHLSLLSCLVGLFALTALLFHLSPQPHIDSLSYGINYIYRCIYATYLWKFSLRYGLHIIAYATHHVQCRKYEKLFPSNQHSETDRALCERVQIDFLEVNEAVQSGITDYTDRNDIPADQQSADNILMEAVGYTEDNHLP